MAELLAWHEDGTPNFDCRTLVAPSDKIGRNVLWKQIEKLFAQPADVALLYFAGHGAIHKNLGGYIFAQDSRQYTEAISMRDVMSFAHGGAKIGEIIIILDCCYSGALGQLPEPQGDYIALREGETVLTATRAEESAAESAEGGIFTSLICEALSGGAADLRGTVTVTSLYAFVDQRLDAWDQRPMLKSYVSQLLPLRLCRPTIDPNVLRKLPEYFESPYFVRRLDPSYEPMAKPHHPEHEAIFSDLQELRAAGLVEPTGGEKHLYWAAMRRKGCRLTSLGKFYWQMVQRHRI